MKYFKIYHQNCKVAKAYWEITMGDFDIEACDYAIQNTPDEDENGNVDYTTMEKLMDEMYEVIKKEAESDDGFNFGDYNLYIRDDDFDKYDIPRF